jgi:hypothetical protein
MLRLKGLDGRPVRVQPHAILAIAVAVQQGAPGVIGTPVGSVLMLTAGQIIVKEGPEVVENMVEAALAPVVKLH